MQVFVTGATGYVGSAIVRELLDAGHHVLGLARSEEAADALKKAGVKAHHGDVTDTQSLSAGARSCDGVIHSAFIHDFSKYRENAQIDERAVEAIATAMEGSNKPLLAVSVTTLLPPGEFGTEDEAPERSDTPRAPSEAAVLNSATRGVNASVVRFPPSVHGPSDKGFIPGLIEVARRTGIAAYIGTGENRWPAVNRLDAARLFRLALEHAQPSMRFHAVAEEGIPMKLIAETIGQGLGIPVRSISEAQAQQHFDWLARFVAVDNPTSSTLTRDKLRWQPHELGLLDDMRQSGYFPSHHNVIS